MGALIFLWAIGCLGLFIILLNYFLKQLRKHAAGKLSALQMLGAILMSAFVTVLVAGGSCAIFLNVVLSGMH